MGGDDYSELYKSVYVTLDASNHDTELNRFRRASKMQLESSDVLPPEAVPFISVIGNYNRNHSIISKPNSEKSKGGTKKKDSSPRISTKKRDPQQQLKIDFLKLLNVQDPSNGCNGLNVTSVTDMMDKMPSLAKEKFLFSAFAEPISALHMLCALDAPLKCIKRCFLHNVDAVFDVSSTIGSPIHYACWFRASVKTIRYIASNVKDPVTALSTINRTKRTALHIACAAKDADVELVQLLTAACPHAAGMVDKDGMTPLHLALTVKRPDLAIIEDLTEVCPKAVCMGAKTTGSTPLHLALEHDKVEVAIIKDLIVTNPRACKLVDAAGNTPLHIAAQEGRDVAVLKLLLKKYPDAVNVPNCDDQTPYLVAKSLKSLGKDVIKMLKPTSVISLV